MAAGGKKPAWVVEKERGAKAEARETLWLFGLHAVRDALAAFAPVGDLTQLQR
jgi:23S rRNA (guanosine2251-2'-O)-methyltransferase